MKSVPLTNGGFTIIDDDDFDLVSKTKWFRNSQGYIAAVKGDGKGGTILMHRKIIDATKDIQVDHIHHRKWDNRKCELRFATKSQNNRNQIIRTTFNGKPKSSEYKGVTKWRNKWMAQITVDGKRIHLGLFILESEAALAYNGAATLYFGEFALLNEIDEERDEKQI